MPWVHIEIMEAARCQIDPQIGGGSLPSFPATSSVLIVFAFCWQSMFKISRMLKAMCWSPWFTVSSVSAHRFSPPNLKTSTPCKCYDARKKFRQQQDETGNLRVGASYRNVRNLLLWAAGLAEMVGPLGERGRKMMQNATVQQAVWAVWNHVRVMKKSSEIKLVTFAWPSKLHYISLPSHSCF